MDGCQGMERNEDLTDADTESIASGGSEDREGALLPQHSPGNRFHRMGVDNECLIN